MASLNIVPGNSEAEHQPLTELDIGHQRYAFLRDVELSTGQHSDDYRSIIEVGKKNFSAGMSFTVSSVSRTTDKDLHAYEIGRNEFIILNKKQISELFTPDERSSTYGTPSSERFQGDNVAFREGDKLYEEVRLVLASDSVPRDLQKAHQMAERLPPITPTPITFEKIDIGAKLFVRKEWKELEVSVPELSNSHEKQKIILMPGTSVTIIDVKETRTRSKGAGQEEIKLMITCEATANVSTGRDTNGILQHQNKKVCFTLSGDELANFSLDGRKKEDFENMHEKRAAEIVGGNDQMRKTDSAPIIIKGIREAAAIVNSSSFKVRPEPRTSRR